MAALSVYYKYLCNAYCNDVIRGMNSNILPKEIALIIAWYVKDDVQITLACLDNKKWISYAQELNKRCGDTHIKACKHKEYYDEEYDGEYNEQQLHYFGDILMYNLLAMKFLCPIVF